MKTKEKYEFRKGQILQLDDIYHIQGIGGGRWWNADDPDDPNGSSGEKVEILEDIKITITIEQ